MIPTHPLHAITGLSRQAQDNLRRAGITTLEQLACLTPDELCQIKGIKSTATAIHAHARAFVEDRPVWHGDFPDACCPIAYMFDLETDPYTGVPWSWGWSDPSGGQHIIITAEHAAETEVALPDGRTIYVVPHQADAWHLFAHAVSEFPFLIFHWTGFDAGITRAHAPAEVREPLLARMHDLHRTFKGAVKFPVSGNSLKTVARYLDFDWVEYDAWDAAYNDYRLWKLRGDMRALARSCNYQQADVEALAVVWRWLVDNRPAQV
ncbi:MAG: ribonuclease H-like domain-containing protein [Anaerolineae bacterium]